MSFNKLGVVKKTKLWLLSITCIAFLQSAFSQSVYNNYQDGKVYLKLKNTVTEQLPDYDAKHPAKFSKEVTKIIHQYGIISIHKAFPKLNTEDLNHTYAIQFGQKKKVEALIKSLQKLTIVQYAEKVPLYKVSLTPNDPSYGNQYALPKISAPNAWGLYTGNHTIKVAIVDNAVMITHSDLNANKWINPGEIPNNGIDDDGDGYIDDVSGFDVADNDNNPAPPVATASPTVFEHGTHCAGIADAVGNNGVGVASIGYNLSLIGVKCEPDNTTNPDQLTYAIQGVEYAIAAHSDVVSMSWGGGGFSQVEQNVFNAGWAQGIIFLAAAGNDGMNETFYPAQYANIVAVGSTGTGDVKSSFSNYGAWVGVMAPGENIYSTVPGTNGASAYGNLSGTSMATPLVAGLCGLMKSYSPNSTNAQIVSCLKSGCDNINSVNSSYVGQIGAGRINAYASMSCLVTIPVANFSADFTQTCTGIIHFSDSTTGTPTSWLWNFGDGSTSTLENPTHQYLNAGTYTVSLKATNLLGNNTVTKTNYIVDNQPAGPAATGASHCGTGAVSLSATTTNTVNWQDSTGAVVSHTNPFVTPTITHTTTWWVQDTIFNGPQNVGPASNTAVSTTGGFFSNSTDRYLTFDALAAFTLVNVTAYAQNNGARTIELRNSAGTVLQSATVTMTIGTNVVTLNFNVPVGTGYELGVNGTANLYRNNDGGNVNFFPYTLPGVVSITGTNAGAGFYYYFYKWTVKSGYCLSQTTTVTATINPLVTLGAGSVTAANCNGGATGSATISVNTGTPNYTYIWSNGQTTATAINLAAATYSVTVNDAAGCSATVTKTVTQPTALNITTTPTNAGCIANGKAVAVVSGGVAGYTYLWSTNGTADSIINLSAASYSLIVTDSHTCTASATTTISSTGAITLTTSQTPAVCNSDSTGTVSVNETGGIGNISYHWSNGAATASVNNLVAGVYNVTVTGNGGCSATASQSVSQPTALAISLAETDATCGNTNGSVTATVTGGIATYNYAWSSGAGSNNVFNNLAAGTVSLTVTDAHNCIKTAATTINAVATSVYSFSVTDVSCSSGTNGNASVTILSGATPITYSWTGGSTGSSINNLTAGTYYVTITDGNNCRQFDTAVIAQPTVIIPTVTAVNPSCNGAADGSASVISTGGTGGYLYTWFNNVAGDSINSLGTGNYAVSVQDANGCTSVANFTIINPPAMTVTIATINDSCFGDTKGSAIITVGSDLPPYNYLWSNNNNTDTISALAAGTYSVLVTDAHNCSVSASVTISQPASLAVYTSSTDDDGSGNGTANIDSITGGTAPYIISWSNGAIGTQVSSLPAGTYTITVTDNNGCTQITSATVNLNIATGLTGVQTDLSFSIYPNPAKAEVILRLNTNLNNLTSVSFKNALGQTILESPVTSSLSTIDLAKIASGVYVVEIKQGAKMMQKKLVISK